MSLNGWEHFKTQAIWEYLMRIFVIFGAGNQDSEPQFCYQNLTKTSRQNQNSIILIYQILKVELKSSSFDTILWKKKNIFILNFLVWL